MAKRTPDMDMTHAVSTTSAYLSLDEDSQFFESTGLGSLKWLPSWIRQLASDHRLLSDYPHSSLNYMPPP